MNIAFLTSEYPHPKVSFAAGIGTSIMNLSKGVVNQGQQVSVLIYGQNKDENFSEDGISFYKKGSYYKLGTDFLNWGNNFINVAQLFWDLL